MKDVSEQKKKSAPEAKGATAVRKFHTHSIPLDMEDIARDWEKPVVDAGIAAKASVIVRVGMLDLGAGTGSFRVREMMHRIAYPLGVHVRADVNLTDIEATCTDGRNRITEVVDLPSTGVNTERIWLLEHFADWFSVNLGKGRCITSIRNCPMAWSSIWTNVTLRSIRPIWPSACANVPRSRLRRQRQRGRGAGSCVENQGTRDLRGQVLGR